MTDKANSGGWGSRLGFILASAGSAVGLGAIWKFPYMAGTNGGSVFMLPYIFFTLTVGVALLIAEFAMGRAGRRGAVGSLNAVCGRPWGIFGGIGVFTVFLILSFYSIVGGWCLKYTWDAVTGVGLISDAEQLSAHFGGFVSDTVSSYGFLFAFLLLTTLIVLRGVQAGIEKLSKVLMPMLFILMIILIIRGVTLPNGWAGVEFLFTPRWEDFNASALFNAMGFCFFSLSLGAGTMITYGSYLDPKPTAGPGLTFVTMPAIFSQMPMGQLFAVFFYICLTVAAITSSVSMLEACTVLLSTETGVSRRTGILITVAGAAVVGFLANLSFGPWADVKFFGKNLFDLLDYVTSNVGMPLSTFGISIAAAWVAWPVTARELQSARTLSPSALRTARIMIGFLSPVFVAIVAAGSL